MQVDLGKLDWSWNEIKHEMIVYKDLEELLVLPDVTSDKMAKKMFDLIISDIKCYIDCFANGEINYNRLVTWTQSELDD